jgi:hypothetical protein
MTSMHIAKKNSDTWSKDALQLHRIPGDDQIKQMLLTDSLQETGPVFN